MFFTNFSIWYATTVGSNSRMIIGMIITAIMLFVSIITYKMFQQKAIPIANLILLFFFNSFVFLSGLLTPIPSQQQVDNLYLNEADRQTLIYAYGNVRNASVLRVQNGNQLTIINKRSDFTLPQSEANHFLIVNKKDVKKVDLSNYTIYNGSEEISKLQVSKVPDFLKPAVKKLKESGVTYIIAKPNSTTNR